MSEKPQKSDATDYSKTLFLPQTEFPMCAGLPQREPEILERWKEIGSTTACANRPAAGPSSCCMTARPTPTATSISGTR